MKIRLEKDDLIAICAILRNFQNVIAIEINEESIKAIFRNKETNVKEAEK